MKTDDLRLPSPSFSGRFPLPEANPLTEEDALREAQVGSVGCRMNRAACGRTTLRAMP